MLLRLTRGLPASGKTTLARAWVDEEPGTRSRVNRDDLRAMLFARDGRLDDAAEDAVTTAEQAAVRALLLAGRDVIVDDTHLIAAHVRSWQALAAELTSAVGLAVEVELVDVDTDVDTCVARDAARRAAGGRGVGEQVIRALAAAREASRA